MNPILLLNRSGRKVIFGFTFGNLRGVPNMVKYIGKWKIIENKLDLLFDAWSSVKMHYKALLWPPYPSTLHYHNNAPCWFEKAFIRYYTLSEISINDGINLDIARLFFRIRGNLPWVKFLVYLCQLDGYTAQLYFQ